VSGVSEVLSMYRVPREVSITECHEENIETEQGSFTLKYPVLSPEIVVDAARKAQNARDVYLAHLPLMEVVEKIDRAIQKWLDPDYPLRRWAEALLPILTGYHSDIIRLELKRYMRNFRKKELLRFLDEEFDHPGMLDGFRPRKSGGMSRAYGPHMIFHVFSGNVPGVQVWSLIMGLLVKSAALGKTSLAEPLMPVLFSMSLAEIDERLAESIVILPWKGGEVELEAKAMEACEALIVYGSDETVEAYRHRVPIEKRFLSYGHKISLAMVGKEALTADRYEDTLHRLAADIAIYDQQSCLAPQMVYVESGGVITPKDFSQLLACELERYEKKWPRSALSHEEAMAIHKMRNQAVFAAINGADVNVYMSEMNTAWTVIFHRKADFSGSPLNRTIHVFAVDDLETAAETLTRFRRYLQSCGLAVGPERLFSLSERLGTCGLNRICAIGEMNRAKPGWHHDGRFNLLDLVRFVDIERTAETLAEQYDPDVE